MYMYSTDNVHVCVCVQVLEGGGGGGVTQNDIENLLTFTFFYNKNIEDHEDLLLELITSVGGQNNTVI